MRSASPTLVALLNGASSFLMADLYTMTLVGGTVLYITTADIPMVWAGHTFTPAGTAGFPGILRSKFASSIGLKIDTMDLTLLCGDSVKLGNIPMVLAAHNGAFDYAQILVQRSFQPVWGDTSPGVVTLFKGDVGPVDISSTQIQISARNFINALNVQMPRNSFMPTCAHLLYDSGCTMVKASFTSTAAVGASPTAFAFTAASSTGKPAGYFETGVLTMTSGAASGARRGVRSFDGTTFTLSRPLPTTPAPGDTFSVVAGCDRSFGTCGSRFSNQLHFRGFTKIPQVETAI